MLYIITGDAGELCLALAKTGFEKEPLIPKIEAGKTFLVCLLPPGKN